MEGEYWVMIVASVLSLLGSLFVLTAYYMFSSLQIFAYRLVKDLAIFCLLYSVIHFLPASCTVTCQMQGVGLTFTSSLIVLWTTVISMTLYLKVVRMKNFSEERYRTKSLYIIVIASSVMTFLPYTSSGFKDNPYGQAGPWCWISDKYRWGFVWECVIFYFPCFLTIFINLTISCLVIRVIKKQYKSLLGGAMASSIQKLIFRLWVYPLVMVICFFPCAIFRFLHQFNPQPEYYARSVCSFTAPLIGAIIAIVYGFTDSVKNALKRRFALKTSELETQQFETL